MRHQPVLVRVTCTDPKCKAVTETVGLRDGTVNCRECGRGCRIHDENSWLIGTGHCPNCGIAIDDHELDDDGCIKHCS